MAELDTFPKLLVDRAARFAERQAMREKEYGIWQSWTWAEVAREVEALAGGLAAMGFRRGDKLAIIGDNRPRLYWSMAAAQSLGGVPVPGVVFLVLAVPAAVVLWRSAVGREIYVIGHNERAARFSGLAVGRIKLALYTLSGLVAATAAVDALPA